MYTAGHEGRKEIGEQLGGRTNSEGGRSNIADARFLDLPCRMAQERVPCPMLGRAM
jgi:hypothetical protein